MAFSVACWVSLLVAVQGMQLHSTQPTSESDVRPLYYPILASHHKTGTVMLNNMEWELSRALNCTSLPPVEWSDSFGPNVAVWRGQTKAPCFELFWHWGGGVPGAKELPRGFTESRVLHFVRSPMSMVASAYLYHKNKTLCDEFWNNEPLKSVCSQLDGYDNMALGPVCKLLGSPKHRSKFYFLHWISDEHSYTQALQRLPLKYGIFLELLRSERELSNMMSAWRTSKKRSDVKTVCLEDVTRNSAEFHRFWSDALAFLGFSVPEHARASVVEAIEHNDIHSGKCEECGLHSVNHTIEKSGDLLADIAAADAELYEGQLLDMTKELGCHQ